MAVTLTPDQHVIVTLRTELWRLVEQAPQVDMAGTTAATIMGYSPEQHPVAILTTREEIARLRKVADGE